MPRFAPLVLLAMSAMPGCIPGDWAQQLTSGWLDGGTSDPSDGTADLAPALADLRGYLDPAQPPGSTIGCRTPGWALTATMSACTAGSYLLPGPCDAARGWVLCSATQVSPAVCSGVPWGFFGARAHGLTVNPPPIPPSSLGQTWLGGSSADTRWIVGCGTSAAQATYDVAVGFSRAVPCHSQPTQPAWAWSCPESMPVTDLDVEQAYVDQNRAPRDGTLCCR